VTTSSFIRIGDVRVGGGARCFVIAEAGVNHNGDVALAERLVDAAADSGADCVKFQTFRPSRLVSSRADKAAYQKETTGGGTQMEMLEKLALPDDAWPRLMKRARERGILFMSTPFDEESADMLVRAGVPALKIGSGELTNHLLLEHVAAAGLPILLSTGMADLDETRAAVDVVRARGAAVAVFHCVSSYPALPDDANLKAMATLRQALACPVGFSDHTLGVAVATAAVALGAELVEKHLTLDVTMEGPDHRASLDPRGMKELVAAIRAAEAAVGDGVKAPRPAEEDVRRVARRSLFWARPGLAGAVVTRDDIQALRPSTGISPVRWRDVVGQRLARSVTPGEPVAWEDLAR
jgi:N-acetylneuraminate synthase/N,N'-diacetyllegionaminate synthase